MFKKIKSLVITKKIFSFLDEGYKLKFVKYNKNLQRNINISLINYKLFKGSYIIYERNGIAKEYTGYDDTLLFVGVYSKGQKNGKSKEYKNDGKLLFEGEYIKGKRYGKGKEYDKNGKLKYEGEYSNGERNGKGKE